MWHFNLLLVHFGFLSFPHILRKKWCGLRWPKTKWAMNMRWKTKKLFLIPNSISLASSKRHQLNKRQDVTAVQQRCKITLLVWLRFRSVITCVGTGTSTEPSYLPIPAAGRWVVTTPKTKTAVSAGWWPQERDWLRTDRLLKDSFKSHWVSLSSLLFTDNGRMSLVIAFSYYLHRNFLTISQFSSNELLHQRQYMSKQICNIPLPMHTRPNSMKLHRILPLYILYQIRLSSMKSAIYSWRHLLLSVAISDPHGQFFRRRAEIQILPCESARLACKILRS